MDTYRKVRYCFFFQAEDGIRDTSVTGVQTCALPILAAFSRIDYRDLSKFAPALYVVIVLLLAFKIGRASCREEWSSRWLPYHQIKKTNRGQQHTQYGSRIRRSESTTSQGLPLKYSLS